jgi:hypothetical protein
MRKIHFEDDGQDVLWWLIDDRGVVQACDMQEAIWKGTEVFMTDRNINLDDIRPGDHLVCKFKDGKGNTLKGGTFIHAVERVEELTAAAADKILTHK